MSEALGNIVDRAMVSEASRRDARGGDDIPSIRDELNALLREKDVYTAKKQAICSRLSEIKALIRGNQLPQGQYTALTREQATLVKRVSLIEVEIREHNAKLKPLQQDLFDKENVSIGHQIANLRREVGGLKEQIRELVQMVKRL